MIEKNVVILRIETGNPSGVCTLYSNVNRRYETYERH